MEDPFIIVKEETESGIAEINKNLERWKKLGSGTSSVARQERSTVKGRGVSRIDLLFALNVSFNYVLI